MSVLCADLGIPTSTLQLCLEAQGGTRLLGDHMPHYRQSWDVHCNISNAPLPLQQMPGFELPRATLVPALAVMWDGGSWARSPHLLVET